MSSLPRARRVPLLLAPAVFLVLAGCATETASTSAPSTPPVTTPSASSSAGHHDAAWSYEGATAPGHWGSLAADYGTCSAGTQQSPIDLPAPAGGPALDLTSSSVAGQTADNGHTVQFTADSGAVTTIDGEQLDLVQMHFHAGSEHTVAGEAAAAEFHFVHTDAHGSLTVVGVLADEGAHNPAFDSYIEGVATKGGGEGTIDLEQMLPESTAYDTYSGSLTTPPCTEGVRWIVLQDPIELDEDQLEALDDAHDHNARPVQPLGDRQVLHTL